MRNSPPAPPSSDGLLDGVADVAEAVPLEDAGALLGALLALLLLAAWALHSLLAAPQYVRDVSEVSSLLNVEEDDEAPTSL